jgi:uncharacterized protein involved in exopolysaccharide biosynthesis
MPGMVTPSDVFAYMLKSSPIIDIIIKECGLVEHYKESKTFSNRPDKALYSVAKKLGEYTKIKVTEERFITITVEDKNKNKAAEVANKYGEALDRTYSKMTMTQGGKMREFIEKRVEQELVLLRQMEDSLKNFQQRYRTVSITDEMKAVIEMTATLNAKIMGQQIELDAIKTYSSPDNSQVNVLENQVNKSKEELYNLISGNKGKTLFIPMAKAPAIGMKLSQLMRDVRIHQELYALLIQQLEQAKILEAKDTPKVQILEKATPPYKKSWPKRALFVLIGLLIGILTSLTIIVVGEWWRVLCQSPDHVTQLDSLTRLLRRR